MSAQFSSSGLLYVYLSGYEEEGNLFIQQIDSYRYIGDEFYYKIMGAAELADEDENMVHIFAVVGPKAKSDAVLSVFENEIKANFERILANKRITTNTQKLDSVGNIFFHCVQEFFCNQLNHFPTHSKGVLWEDVAAYVLNNVAGWKVTGRRIRTGAQEIDLSIANFSLDNKLWQLGAYILVECKNWNTHVDIHQIRNIAHISTMKGNKTAILFASNGITADAQEEILRLTASNLSIVCITACDLKRLRTSDDCRLLILDRWEKLQNTPELSTVI